MCVFAAASVQRQCSTLSNDRKFLLDMLYSKTSTTAPVSLTATAAPDTTEEEGSVLPGEGAEKMPRWFKKSPFKHQREESDTCLPLLRWRSGWAGSRVGASVELQSALSRAVLPQ